MPDCFDPDNEMRVLLVEDEYFLADDLRLALEEAGAVILGPVGTVAQALKLLDGPEPPHAAVLDVNLHDEPVWPLADALEAREIRLVFASGYSQTIVPARFRNRPFFHKPIDTSQLISALQKYQDVKASADH